MAVCAPVIWRLCVIFTKDGNPARPLDLPPQTGVRRAGGTLARWHNPGAQSMAATPRSFAQDNFADVHLGDPRRTRRLVRSVEQICRHPGGTLPDKLKQPCELRAFYHLMNRPEATHQLLIEAHAARTHRLIEQCGGVLLLLHDSTELDYTSKT